MTTHLRGRWQLPPDRCNLLSRVSVNLRHTRPFCPYAIVRVRDITPPVKREDVDAGDFWERGWVVTHNTKGYVFTRSSQTPC